MIGPTGHRDEAWDFRTQKVDCAGLELVAVKLTREALNDLRI
jgi:hypothetical protein